jgi:hypothetical protein
MPNLFPAIDPIPLPAPVWLFKVLHDLTLTLHFCFLSLLLGGLFLAILWNLFGHWTKNQIAVNASGVVVNRLPVVTTYVINLGIPPLLFVQVLYGRAIYTSTILIGAYWISVIFAVMAAYFILYRMAYLAGTGKPWWGWGIVALALLGHVGHVYSMASTLMFRPEVWPGMYDATVSGTKVPPFDPTMLPRLGIVLIGALAFGALGTSIYTSKKILKEEVKSFIRRWAGLTALIALPFLGYCGYAALSAQPALVVQNLSTSWGNSLTLVWPAGLTLSLLAALALVVSPKGWGWGKILFVSLPPFLSLASFVVLRDLVRDFSLAHSGFDVWASPVNTNWLVVGLFLGLFVAGLALLAWVWAVLLKAKPVEENYA